MIGLAAGLQDLCVGDVWETQERRGLSSFTTAIAVDRFMLITNLKEKSESMFLFPEKVNLDRYVLTVLLCILCGTTNNVLTIQLSVTVSDLAQPL